VLNIAVTIPTYLNWFVNIYTVNNIGGTFNIKSLLASHKNFKEDIKFYFKF